MSNQNPYEILKALNFQQINIPSNLIFMQKANNILAQVQKYGAVIAKQMNRLNGKEITQITQMLSRMQYLVQPLIEPYLQLDKPNQVIQETLCNDVVTSLAPDFSYNDDVVENEICNVTEVLVDKALKYGVILDKLPNKATIQEITFIITYFITRLSFDKLINWIKQLPQMLLSQINSAGNQTLSGIFNIITMLSIASCIYKIFHQQTQQ